MECSSNLDVVVITGKNKRNLSLLNALIGQDVLTEIVDRIHIWNNDQIKGYNIAMYGADYYFDKAGKVQFIEEVSNYISEHKPDPFLGIEIEGKIPFFKDNIVAHMKIVTQIDDNVLSDIEKSNTVFIYIIDVPSLFFSLKPDSLKNMFKKIKKSKKDFLNKLFFVVDINRGTEFEFMIEEDISKVQMIMKKTTYFLSKAGLDKATVIPIDSVKYRILEESKRRLWSYSFKRVKYEYLRQNFFDHVAHCEKYALIPTKIKKTIEKQAEEYQEKQNETGQLLIHTGMPVLKEMILDYARSCSGISSFSELEISQIISANTIRNENRRDKKRYFFGLKYYINKLNIQGSYIDAQMRLYESILLDPNENITEQQQNTLIQSRYLMGKYKYFMFWDFLMIVKCAMGNVEDFRVKKILELMRTELVGECTFKDILAKIQKLYEGDGSGWKDIEKHASKKGYLDYARLMYENILFLKETPYRILVTATMSAGKSTFINALTGKMLNRAQNMACTSKIHKTLSKPWEDGYIAKVDHEFIIDADQETLLRDHEKNESDEILIGTHYNGALSGKRITIIDSPGINYSGEPKHKEITNEIIRSGEYELLIYIINATQIATEDDLIHLKYVKKEIGCKQILFVVNKTDALCTEDERIEDVLENIRTYLQKSGFEDPIICPVSSRAAYLAKKSWDNKTNDSIFSINMVVTMSSGTSTLINKVKKFERRELESYMDKFEYQNLSPYYQQQLKCMPLEADDEIKALFNNCGFAYLEKIITMYVEGKTNDTGIC